MKILFLDVDGVLNSADTMAEYVHLDPMKVIILREVINITGAKIVISSSWRIQYSVKEMQTLLYRTGFHGCHRIIDATPRSSDGIRGGEIEAWLKDHDDVDNYVILDDSSDFLEHQFKFHVKTDWERGLTWKKAHELIALLNKEN